jgi:hypothetical protein
MKECANRTGKTLVVFTVVAGCLLLVCAASKTDERILLLPRLQSGDTLRYESHARVSRYVKTKSNVATMFEPTPLNVDFSTNLQLAVEDFHSLDHRPMMAAVTQLLPADAPDSATGHHPVKVDFTIGGDGVLTHADGLDDLAPEQRLAWQFWLAQFAFGWTLPSAGVKPGEKWKSVEAEHSPSPIADLVWDREATYVQDDACPILRNERCAVFLVNSILRQKSNPDNATPEDYKLHELKTSGAVTGTNQTVIYISRDTGLLLRASEDIEQAMDVTIAKADGSNQVQYLVEVKSHFETVFVPTAPPRTP